MRNKTRRLTLATSIQHSAGHSRQINQTRNNRHTNRKGRSDSVSADRIVVETSKDSTGKRSALEKKTSARLQGTKPTHTNEWHFCTLPLNYLKKKLRNPSHLQQHHKVKYLEKNLTKDENNETLMKEIVDNTLNGKKN